MANKEPEFLPPNESARAPHGPTGLSGASSPPIVGLNGPTGPSSPATVGLNGPTDPSPQSLTVRLEGKTTIASAATAILATQATMSASEAPDVAAFEGTVAPPLNPKLVAQRIFQDPQFYSTLFRRTATEITVSIQNANAQKPNDLSTLTEFSIATATLETWRIGFVEAADVLQEIATIQQVEIKNARAQRAAELIVDIYDEVIEVCSNDKKSIAKVIAQLGIAGAISGALAYTTGIPPWVTFPIAIAGLNGSNMWEAAKTIVGRKEK
jgi:hypothetical protein